MAAEHKLFKQQQRVGREDGMDPASTNPMPGTNAHRSNAVDYDTVYTNAKAGMEEVDQEKVKQVVYEMSKDSAYFENESRKNVATEKRIERMKEKLRGLTAKQLSQAAVVVQEQHIVYLESLRNLTRVWCHIDMDAFYASVEQILDPSLAGVPFAVGSKSMISTASYAARKFGVRSAMPGFIAESLCPHIRFVKPKFDQYKRFSMITRGIFAKFDPDFEAQSLDEASMDVTDYIRVHGLSTEACARKIREAVCEATGGLTCSVGVAPNKMLAKICSDLNKPDGQYILESTRETILDFMRKLPCRKIPGIGRVTEKLLQKSLGIETCGDLIENAAKVSLLFSKTSYEFFMRSALGIASYTHKEHEEGSLGRKGISCERTFKPTDNADILEAKLLDIAGVLAQDMDAESLRGKTLTLKIKLSNFLVKTRCLTLDEYICSKEKIFARGRELLRSELPAEIRLMGLRMSNFQEELQRDRGQLGLESYFRESDEKEPKKVEKKSGSVKEVREMAEWECPACTFRNCGTERWCEMCMTSRISGRRLQDPAVEHRYHQKNKKHKKMM